MNAVEASLLALKGKAIGHRSFKSPDRWITFLTSAGKIEVFDSHNPIGTCWSTLVATYGYDGWKSQDAVIHNQSSANLEVHAVDELGEYIDVTYLSDQMEELTDLLTKTLELADKNKRVKK